MPAARPRGFHSRPGPGWMRTATGGAVSPAARPGSTDPEVPCPHAVQRRRWNHQLPVVSQSAQPGPLGGTDGSIALAVTLHHPIS